MILASDRPHDRVVALVGVALRISFLPAGLVAGVRLEAGFVADPRRLGCGRLRVETPVVAAGRVAVLVGGRAGWGARAARHDQHGRQPNAAVHKAPQGYVPVLDIEGWSSHLR